ncbi:MAG TPA: SigB/SigF/SigG family RNA polymerase sigma factor [Nocardioidaceae bacterium]|nr:SigB/SigF/SigG family RNA polymerase sigma factor [Nocardioidaceae bacterium]
MPSARQNVSSQDARRRQRRSQRSRQAARTHRLLSKARASHGERRERLQTEAVLLNMDMARSIAARYWGRGEPADDLTQVAYVGLMKAIRGFDPRQSDDFASYAVPTIAGEVKRHFRDKSWTVKAPRWVQELQADIAAATDGLTQDLQRLPRPAETAERLGVPEKRVDEALAADGCFTPTSIDARGPTGDGYALADRLGIQDRDLDRAEIRVALAPLIEELPERDRTILDLRFFKGWTQSQIASNLGVTQMQVSRLLSRILKNLRMQLTAG